ncbi:hypothetical protein ElyMa_004614200 [Elysia marginata]|uniref:Uncharacterized protein n=1 Tax=Elysia marginata TaxID=1093978 RepID=A0AAV4HXQ0_9GAST|nr:hypothetical protein ElyMa_004614200 [Elysia marginata]
MSDPGDALVCYRVRDQQAVSRCCVSIWISWTTTRALPVCDADQWNMPGKEAVYCKEDDDENDDADYGDDDDVGDDNDGYDDDDDEDDDDENDNADYDTQLLTESPSEPVEEQEIKRISLR